MLGLLSRAILDRPNNPATASDFPNRTNPPFFVRNVTEPSVQSLFADFVRGGDTVFDIGAHIGALTQVLSRRVGPRGLVVSFEANPNTLPQLCANTVKNAQFNCFLVPMAVTAASGQFVSMRASGAASRLAHDGDCTVETIALDDFCSDQGIHPTFIKLDIEGGEYDALRGAAALLDERRPTIVLEHTIGDDRAIELLRAAGYWLFCADRYCEIKSSADFDPEIDVANIAAIPAERRRQFGYEQVPICVDLADVVFSAPTVSDGAMVRRADVDLDKPGRYCLSIQGSAGSGHAIFSRASTNNFVVSQLWTEARYFMRNHRRLIFNASSAGRWRLEIGEVGVNAPTLSLTNARLHMFDRSC